MAEVKPLDLLGLFGEVPDPRERNARYPLGEVLVMALLATYAGCCDFVSMETFCQCKKHLLKQWFGIARIPSHDTFNRIFRMLDNDTFEALFASLMAPYIDTRQFGLKHLALDGKTVSNSALHVVTAFCTNAGMSVAQKDTGKGKKNELATMVDMVNHLKLKGSVVTADAMGCNEKLFAAIAAKGGDYTVQLKANQKNALDSVQTHFAGTKRPAAFTDEAAKERAGLVERAYFAHGDLKDMPFLAFTGLKTIVKALKTVTGKTGEKKTETRYYLSSLADPAQIAGSIRNH